MAWGRVATRNWSSLSFGVALSLAACSLIAPPDSDLVGKRPAGGSDAGGSGTGGSSGTAAGTEAGGTNGGTSVEAGAGGQPSEGGNSPGKPVDVGTPTGEWAAGPGLKTRFAAEVGPANAHHDYPRPRLTRHTWATLNGLWEVIVNGSRATVPKFDGTQILVPFPLESQLSGVEGGSLSDKQFLWYRRTFELPEAWRGQRVLLHFGAVDWEASVRVNGVDVVTHQGGYDGFSVDITEQLLTAAEQEVVVRVFDPTDVGTQPLGKQALVPDTGNSFSAVSGIWQSVWLEPVPEVSIQNLELSADPASGMLAVTPTLSGAPAGTTLRVIVLDEGVEVARAEAADGGVVMAAVPAVKTWSPDSPFLYDLTLELWRGDELLDSADSYFAFRSVALGKDGDASKLLLNDEPLLSMAVLSQGYWPEGLYTPPTDAAVKADLTLIKNLGFNAVRVHEKLESERFYYWADRLGVLVWQDVPAGTSSTVAAREQFGSELSAMVSERRAHPSLAVWTLFTSGRGLPGADVAKLVEQVKALSTEQLVIGASGTDDEGSGDLRDRPDRLGVSSPIPDERGVVLGQYGSLSRPITGHTWSGDTGAAQTTPDTTRFVELARRARGLARRPGLSAAVFRQLTDVENELDGLVTYDRAITKVTANTIARANTGELEPIVPLVQASEFEVAAAYLKDARSFRYVMAAPGNDQWNKPVFNDNAWTAAVAGIGNTVDAGARVRTLLAFNEIWTRTKFTLDEKPATGRVIVRLMYDEDTQVYVNGVRASDTYRWVTSYGDFLASDGAFDALVAGENTIATHTINLDGGRYIDVGLWLTTDPPSYRAADVPAATTAGLTYADYDLTLDSLPADISKVGPAARAAGTASIVGSYAPALAADNARALRLHGYVEVVQDGVYTFFVDTDDGARLSIGTSAVAESFRNDGTGVTRRAGNIALSKGKHEITIDYFANDNAGANNFALTWAGPGFNMSAISAGNLSH